MKVAILENYNKNGSDLVIKNIKIPEPNENEVLVKVYTTAVNPLDNMIIKKEVKLIVNYKTPLIMGNEFAGVVEKVGDKVTKYKKGDKVYARMPLDKIGTFAEYLTIDQQEISIIPGYLTFEEATAIPLTALTAMQAFEILKIKKGRKIFITGGSGSFGAMAIPLAKAMGLYVITNGNAESEDRVRKLGADEYIDYKKEDYTQKLSNIDYVIDTIGEREIPREFSVLKQGGSLVSLRAMPNGTFAKRMRMPLLKKIMFTVAGYKYDKLAKKNNQTYDFIFVHSSGKQLEEISKIFEEKEIHPSIDKIFSLDEINDALKKIASGGSQGKTIIKIK